jgi:asparagine synthetase B (glutamine-hydrolysing)
MRRGQDDAAHLERDGLVFWHFLLNVTGVPTTQPFVDDDVIALYNGEIYNLLYVRSDGENIIPMYRKHGALFPRELDGEFAIAVYDFGADRAMFIADRFATKPLWRNGIECASYESGVGGHKIAANTIEVVQLSTGQDLGTLKYHEWDWNQHVGDYGECIAAFEAAVAKRYKPGCFIGLSSGYDSGAIACALRGKEFKAYTIVAAENPATINARAQFLDDITIIGVFDLEAQTRHLHRNAEEFLYAIRYDNVVHVAARAGVKGGASGSVIATPSYKDDYAAKALSHICMLANADGRKVCLSGGGADEILSDYSLIPRQSQFKGKFPQHLYQWANFTESCQYSYLGKEECVGGSWNIETRYPFLDTAFVQSFLSLACDLKNRHYKAPLHEYMTREGFPFERDVKRGWSP